MSIRKRSVALLILPVLALGCQQNALIQPRAEVGETPKSADAFVDTIGVNTHFYYLDRKFADGSSIISKIKDAGIRHVREGLDINYFKDPSKLALLNELNAGGVRFSIITSYNVHTAEEAHAWVKQFGPEKLTSIENRNEPDLFDYNYETKTWPVQKVHDYQIALWNAFKNDSSTRSIEVIGSPLISTENAVLHGDAVANYMDRANIHNYLSTRHPETLGWGGDGYGSLDYAVRRVAKPMKPGNNAPLSTETCYQNTDIVNSGNGQPNFSGLPEKFSGRYIPRQYLFSFNYGIPRTYCYQFWNEGTGQASDKDNGEFNFGFVRYDGSPKPAYTAIKNMIGLLNDPGPAFTLNKLDYKLEGNVTDVQKTLLQKRNGDYYLALWIGKASWEPNQQVELSVADQQVTLKLPSGITSATSYALDDNGAMSTTPLTISDSQTAVTVTDRVRFIQLSE
jgi:hypothetical protein